MKKIKKIITISIVIIAIILIGILSLSYTITKNTTYKENTLKNIQNNYNIEEKINYSNTYGNYYILTTPKNIIVLNKEYKEILKKPIDYIKPIKKNYKLIYKTNKLMYEKTILKNNHIIYEYYDAKNYKRISTTTLEK